MSSAAISAQHNTDPTPTPILSAPCPPLGLRRHGLVLLLYIALTCLATFPLITRPHRMLIGTPGDSLVWPWNFTWTRQALIEHRLPFFSDHLYRPFHVSLLHHTHSFFYGFLYCLGAFFYDNPFFWSNLFMLSSFVLAAYGTFMLARLVSGFTPGALLAGAIYAFCSLRMDRMFGHLNLLSTEYISWFLYFVFRGARENRVRHFAAVALCLAAAAWNDYYNGLFLLLFTVLFLLLAWPLGLNYGWKLRDRLRALPTAVLLATALLLPLAWGLWRTVTATDIQTRFVADQFSVGILNYLLPPPGHRLLYRWLLPFYHDGLGNESEATVFFGYSAIFLMLCALVSIRRRSAGFQPAMTAGKMPALLGEMKYLFVCIFLFLVFSFGTTMRWGEGTITLPYAWFLEIPFFKDFRSPARFGGMVCLCSAVLAACGLRALTTASSLRKTHFITGSLIALVMLENLYAPHRRHYDPLDPAHVPLGLIARIKADRVPGAVLTIPFAHEDFPSIWLQTLHRKPAITGVLSRPTDYQMNYYNDMGVSGWFRPDPRYPYAVLDPLAPPALRENWSAGRIAWDALPNPWSPEKARRFCYFFDLRYLIVPPPILPTDVAGRLKTELFPLQAAFRERDAWLGILEKQPEQFPIRIDSGSIADNYYFLANFAQPAGGCRWLIGREGTLAIRLAAPRNLTLRISAGYPEHLAPTTQTLSVRVGGQKLLDQTLQRGWSDHVCAIPAALLRAGYNYVTLGASQARSPFAAQQGLDRRPLSIMFGVISFE